MRLIPTIAAPMRILLFLITIPFFALSAGGQTKLSRNLGAKEIARVTLPSVLLVVVANETTQTSVLGSGFLIRGDVVVTNFHVIRNGTKGHVKVVGKDKLYEITGVVGVDVVNDLALLKLRQAVGRPLALAPDDSLSIGDTVYAIGSPKGLEGTFSQGIVSSLRREAKKLLCR